jgi:hypothetical protein
MVESEKELFFMRKLANKPIIEQKCSDKAQFEQGLTIRAQISVIEIKSL